MFKKIKAYFEKKKQKEKDYWDKLDLDREEKIWKIKKSKYDCRLKDSKGFFFYSLALISIFLAMPIYFLIYSHIDFDKVDNRTKAYAEEINISTVAYEDVVNDSTAIVNFNQYIQNDKINGTYSAGQYFSNILPVGQYYINIDSSNTADILLVYSGGGYYRIQVRNGGYSNILTIENEISAIQFDNDIIYTNFYAINLSQMFGSDNTPNLEQAQELFISEYYAYDSGSAVSLSGLNSYADGYNKAASLVEYMPTGSSFITSIQDVDLPNSNLYGLISRGSSGITISTNSTTKDLAGYYPFNLVVPIGTKVNIVARAGHNNGNFSTPLKFAYIDAVGNINVITSANITSNSGFNISFYSPIDLKGVYLIVPSDESLSYSVSIWNIEISMLVNNAIAGIQSSYDSGYEKGVEFASRSYSVGGNGYNQIFEAGRLQGIDDAGNYTFLSLLTTAIDVPINSVLHMLDFDLLGMNMKSFYLSMFTFAIIVFVIKLLI